MRDVPKGTPIPNEMRDVPKGTPIPNEMKDVPKGTQKSLEITQSNRLKGMAGIVFSGQKVTGKTIPDKPRVRKKTIGGQSWER
jgi:hypothetical protein